MEQKKLNVSGELARGYLNGWGAILAYGTLGLAALLLLGLAGSQASASIPRNTTQGGCGCRS